MNARNRLWTLVAGLALTVGWIAWDSVPGAPASDGEGRSGPVASAAPAAQRLQMTGLVASQTVEPTQPLADRRAWGEWKRYTVTDPFIVQARADPSVLARPAATAQASAPAGSAADDTVGSVQVIGKARRGQDWEVYLLDGETTVIAREGDRLSGDRVVERISPPRMRVRRLGSEGAAELKIGDAL